jgi:hypothetical protein
MSKKKRPTKGMKDRRKTERRKDAKVLPGTAKLVWGKPVKDLAATTGYTASYLSRCRLSNREPSLHAVHAIALATGKPMTTVLAEFWPKAPQTLKAHLALMKDGQGKRTAGKVYKTKGKAKRAGRKGATKAKRAAKRVVAKSKAKPSKKREQRKSPVKRASKPRATRPAKRTPTMQPADVSSTPAPAAD